MWVSQFQISPSKLQDILYSFLWIWWSLRAVLWRLAVGDLCYKMGLTFANAYVFYRMVYKVKCNKKNYYDFYAKATR